MQIVIDIPEEDYKRLKEQGMFGRVDVFKRAVREAIVLPKGHGRLIDADKFIENYEKSAQFTMNLLPEYANEIKAWTDEICIEIENTPAIIEADKEGADENNDNLSSK